MQIVLPPSPSPAAWRSLTLSTRYNSARPHFSPRISFACQSTLLPREVYSVSITIRGGGEALAPGGRSTVIIPTHLQQQLFCDAYQWLASDRFVEFSAKRVRLP